ncbi:hypothetical protein ACIBSV_01275 [Embleya sp. NPDC050154]|uniref:hypothetical protein n=1 Tax=unclassified Embleya TaxID=2699296 RepID=UPI0037B05384
MRSGICTKCGQASVVRRVGGLREGAVDILAWIRFATWRKTRATHYVCTGCGFFEVYLTKPETLAALARAWEPCPPRPSTPPRPPHPPGR